MLLHHSLLYGLARGLPGIIGFATIAVYTRLLPPELYGQYALVLANVQLANAILFQWLRLGLLRFLPGHAERPATLLATLLAGYGAMAALVLALGLLAALLAPDATWRHLALLAVPMVWSRAWFELNQAIAQSQLAPSRYGYLALIRALLALVGGTALILVGLGVAGPLIALIFATLLPSLLLMSGAWRGVFGARPSVALSRTLLGYGLPLTVTFALYFVVASSDRFLVAWFLGTDAAGAYAAAYELGWQGGLVLMSIVNLAGYPLVMRAMESGGPAAARHQLQLNGLLLLAVGLPVLLGSVILAPNIARVVLGAPFRADGARLLPWIALAAFIGGGGQFYTNLAFQLGRYTLGQLWVTLTAALVNVGLNVIWIPRFGLLGAAWATVIAYLVALVLGWWLGRRAFPLPGLPADALKVIAAGLALALALWPVRDLEGPLALAGQVGLGGLVYALALGLLDLAVGRGRLVRLLRRGGRPPNRP